MTEIIQDRESPTLSSLQLLRRYSKLLIALGVVGALAGFAASQVMKPKWTARATVQVGQLASIASGGITFRLIENQLTVADRYNLPAMRLQVLQSLGLPAPGSNAEANLYFESMRAVTGKSPDVVNLQVSGYTRESALAALNASFTVLNAAHSPLFNPTVARMKSDLDQIVGKLAIAQQEYDKSVIALRTGSARGVSNTTQDVLVTNMATVINTQILDLKKQATQIQEALEPSRTYPTRMLGAAYAPEKASTPGPLLLTMAGLALGIVIGALFLFVRNATVGRRD